MDINKILVVVLVLLLIFVGTMVLMESQANTAFAAAPVNEEVPVDTQPEVTAPAVTEPVATEPIEPELTPQEKFMAGVDDSYSYEMYTQLFELYDYEQFMARSEIPQYFQTLYPNKFSDGTIRSSGCGITCLSMIATYLFETVVTPDMLVVYDRGANSAAAMEKAILEMGMRCDMYYGNDAVNVLDPALENGNPCILLVRAPSIFTQSGHFIVVTGKTEDGRYIVNDPNMENYFTPAYVDAYMNGFTREQLLYGLVGTYVFDSKAEFDGDPALIPHR